jgi:acyl-CoA synthetase (NDP forming)
MFAPSSVAVIGASRIPGRIGYNTVDKLLTCGFGGHVVAVNSGGGVGPHGVQYQTALTPSDAGIDLAIVCVPAIAVADSLEDCGRAGVRSAVVVAAGMGESGTQGKALESQIKSVADKFGIRVLGPNTFGFAASGPRGASLLATYTDLNTSRDDESAVAVVGQGGGMTSYLGSEGLAAAGIAPRLLIDTGNEIDVDLADCVSYIIDLPEIRAVGLVVESARNGRKLCAAVAEAAEAGVKTIIFRLGRTTSGLSAASLHTGALGAGNAALWDELAALGALVTGDERQALSALVALNQPRATVKAPRVGVLSGSGGFGVHAADLFEENGIRLATVSTAPTDDEARALRTHHPTNPLDLGGLSPRSGEGDGSNRLAVAMNYLLRQPGVDIAVLWQHKVPADDIRPAYLSLLSRLSWEHGKPVFTCGSNSPTFARESHEAGIGAFLFPSDLAAGLTALGRAEPMAPAQTAAAPSRASRTRSHIGADGIDILQSAGVRAVRSITLGESSAVEQAVATLGTPVVLKLVHDRLVHKSEIGAVRIVHSADNAREVRDELLRIAQQYGYEGATVVAEEFASGFEVAVGAYVDPLVGPTVMVGRGGIDIETVRDVAFALAPVDTARAEKMIAGLKCAALLGGSRSPEPYDVSALATLVVQISRFIADKGDRYPGVDLNPVMVRKDGLGVIAADAVVNELADAN